MIEEWMGARPGAAAWAQDCHTRDDALDKGSGGIAGGGGGVFSSYTHLMAMLGQGWQVEPPVYVRPRWRSDSRPERENTYHFVLWKGNRVTLISVLECPELQQFLMERRLSTDQR